VILLDTDILIDVALDRAPHADAAAGLLTLLERRPRMAFVGWHTLSNFYYLVSPTRGKDDARAFLVDLTRFVSVAPTDTEDFRFAAGLALPDFEDALQVAAARACGASYIATRNVRDFRTSPVPARTPAQLVEELG
jgi:predicted nucleic acid-binding protein